jgi:hypothetical protein
MACALAAVAGIFELAGIFDARRKNCVSNPGVDCESLRRNKLSSAQKPELVMEFKNLHYASVVSIFLDFF